MPGRKTHEQQLRTWERKSDVPDARQMDADLNRPGQSGKARHPKEHVRESEFALSQRGMHQESDHNKHSRGTQSHKPQRHKAAEEKQ